jgi:hypothetical protein
MKSTVSVFGPSAFRPYTPALFLARCAATLVAYPAQNLIRAHGVAKGDPDGSRGADEFEVSTLDAPARPSEELQYLH